MTNSVYYSYAPPANDYSPESDYENTAISEDSDFLFLEEASPVPPNADHYAAPQNFVTDSQLHSRLHSLLQLASQNGVSSERLERLQQEIRALEGQINFAVSLPPETRAAEFSRIMGEIGNLEAVFLTSGGGLGKSEVDSDLSVDERGEKAGKQLEKMHSKGWLSDELYEKLKKKFDHFRDAQADPDLRDAAAGLLEDLETSVEQIQEMYVEDGKEVDAIDNEETDAPKNGTLKALLQLSGLNEDQAMAAFRQAFPSSSISSAKDLSKAIEKEEAPFAAPPSVEVIKFLQNLDAEFAQSVAACKPWVHTVIGPNLEKASSRLNVLLNAMYGGDHIIRVTQPETSGDYLDWQQLNEITFDGVSYSFTKEAQGQSHKVTWEVLDETGKPVSPSSGGSSEGFGLPGAPGLPNLPGPGDEIFNTGKDIVEDGAAWVGENLNPTSWF